MMNESYKGRVIDLKEILSMIRRRKWLVIIPTLIGVGVAFGAIRLMNPIFESSTIIWIDRPSNVSRELVNLIGGQAERRQADTRGELAALQNELTSQTYLTRLIQDLKLDNDPAVARASARRKQNQPQLSLDQIKYSLLTDQLKQQIHVDDVGQDQIRIAVESEDPVRARDMAARLATILEEEKAKYELDRILDNQSFADLQLRKTEHDYQVALDSLTASQSRLSKMQLPENISSETNRREIQSSVDKTKLDMSNYSDELAQLKNQLAEFELTNPRVKYTDSLVDLRTEIDGQIATSANMMEHYVWDDQVIININIRINDNIRMLEDEINKAVEQQYAALPKNQRDLLSRYFIVKEHVEILQSREKQMRLALERIDDRTNLLPKLQAHVSELQGQVQEARRYRDAFRSEEATVGILSERAKDRTKYKVIEPARVPLSPIWPDKKKILVMGLALGLVLGGAVVFGVEMLDRSFKRVEDIEDELDLPVLATIPKIENLNIRR